MGSMWLICFILLFIISIIVVKTLMLLLFGPDLLEQGSLVFGHCMSVLFLFLGMALLVFQFLLLDALMAFVCIDFVLFMKFLFP